MVYPNTISHSNRGMGLENDLNITNNYYIEKDIAIVYKKPTPIRVTKVSYNCVGSSLIKEGFYEKPSTTDYNGIYKGKYIDFEAKEVKRSNCFPLKNIHKHQVDHLIKINKHGGISFIIVKFCDNNSTYLLETNKLCSFIKENNRKSIPIKYFEEYGYKIDEKYNPRLDYIKIINNLYFNEVES